MEEYPVEEVLVEFFFLLVVEVNSYYSDHPGRGHETSGISLDAFGKSVEVIRRTVGARREGNRGVFQGFNCSARTFSYPRP